MRRRNDYSNGRWIPWSRRLFSFSHDYHPNWSMGCNVELEVLRSHNEYDFPVLRPCPVMAIKRGKVDGPVRHDLYRVTFYGFRDGPRNTPMVVGQSEDRVLNDGTPELHRPNWRRVASFAGASFLVLRWTERIFSSNARFRRRTEARLT